jgi:glycine/D-amino acid oxidase-like deaminating enzyme
VLTPEQVNGIMGRPTSSDDEVGLYRGGIYEPNCGSVNPLRLTLGLADAVERWGVRIYEDTKVVKLVKKEEEERRQRRVDLDVLREKGEENGEGGDERRRCDRGRYAVITDGGHVVRCDHVVLCTGAASTSRDVSRRLSRSFLPFYTYMTATEPLGKGYPMKDGALEKELSRGGGRLSDNMDDGDGNELRDPPAQPAAAPTYGDDHLILNYWRGNGNGSIRDYDDGSSRSRVLFGSLGDTYPFPMWFVSLRLRNALSEVYPQLRDVRFDEIWGGKLAFSPNSMPLIGRDLDFDDDDEDNGGENLTKGGVWYATAFAGHGIIPTAVAGSLIANAILGIPDRQQWKLFHEHFPPSSWNGYPFSRLGAGTVLMLYNVWDWLGKRGVPLPSLPDLW